MSEEEGAAQIDLDLAPPLFFSDFDQRGKGLRNSGIVNE
jgi:hypothetical protein